MTEINLQAMRGTEHTWENAIRLANLLFGANWGVDRRAERAEVQKAIRSAADAASLG